MTRFPWASSTGIEVSMVGEPASVSSSPELEALAGEALGFFDHVTASARSQLTGAATPTSDVFAFSNFDTASAAATQLDRIRHRGKRELEQILGEPAIARLTVLVDDERPRTIYITRVTPPGAPPEGIIAASYRSPIGRLASLAVGSDDDIGRSNYVVLGRANFTTVPGVSGWDSAPTEVRRFKAGSITIRSLRDLLASTAPPVDALSLLERQLAEGRDDDIITVGIRRGVINKMGLRDRPTLDSLQDAIFRLQLDARLLIVGPPGSGKTTTLIKRLGTKLSLEYPEPGELQAVARSAAGSDRHATSWVFFTPTELLKQYLKEAFAKEGVAASEQMMKTWTGYRHDLARNVLGILASANVRGGTMRPDMPILLEDTERRQTEWYDDFTGWLGASVWDECRASAERLARDRSPDVAAVGRRVAYVLSRVPDDVLSELIDLDQAVAEAGSLSRGIGAEVEAQLRRGFSHHLLRERELLDDLLVFVSGLGPIGDEAGQDGDDDDDDDEDRIEQPRRLNKDVAFAAYTKAVRAKALASARGRSVTRGTVNARVLEWVGERLPAVGELRLIGERLDAATALRRLSNALPRLTSTIPRRYRRFRWERQKQGLWYAQQGFSSNDLSPSEVDLLILSILKMANRFLADARMAQRIEAPRFASLTAVASLRRNQVVADEVTDFSPLQVAAMAALCDPSVDSFTACGDFSQRITASGVRTEEDFRWAVPRLEVRRLDVTYRHTRPLAELAHAIASLGDLRSDAVLPDDIVTEGVAPVLATAVSRDGEIAWFAERILEIERSVQRLPSIAILVNSEDEVANVAESLGIALEANNVQVSACPDGKVVGQETAVRVFDVQHIKGLEFEAVFFSRVDRLAAQRPDLFDKFLYVGATRAATYLGITCGTETLPDRMAKISRLFGEDWSGT